MKEDGKEIGDKAFKLIDCLILCPFGGLLVGLVLAAIYTLLTEDPHCDILCGPSRNFMYITFGGALVGLFVGAYFLGRNNSS